MPQKLFHEIDRFRRTKRACSVEYKQFVTTAFYLTWRLVATIPWHDSWFALIFGILLWGSEVVSAITGYILIWNKQKDFELKKPEIAK